jgi:DNA-binding response OmpR family regulator
MMDDSDLGRHAEDRGRGTRSGESGTGGEPQQRIAVINDDTLFLDLMHDLLEQSEGFQVSTCKEADQAYAFVKELRPDLVILDIRIGHQESGWVILELLTLDPHTRPIPVIVCSAAITDLQAHQPMLERLGVDVLPKPFDLEMLLDKITAALRRGREPREA